MNITYLYATISVTVKKPLTQSQIGKAIGQLINGIFSDDGEWTKFHKSRKRKGYTFSSLFNDNLANGYFDVAKGDFCKFYLYCNNVELMNLIENKLFESDYFKVNDVIIEEKVWKGHVSAIQVKNPLLLKDRRNGANKIYVLRDKDSEETKQEYLDYLNHFIKEDFEYITGEVFPENYRYIKEIRNPKVAHYEEENGKKLIGTKALFIIDTSLMGKLITQHLVTHGIGNKSSYLGAGSVILKGD